MTDAHRRRQIELAFLRLWHAALAGGYLVAYVTGDENTYAMHLFSGYLVLAVLALRLIVGLFAPPKSPLRLPRPSVAKLRDWLGGAKGRNPLFAWIGAILLAVVGLAAVSGALADVVTWLEDPHEAVAEASLWFIVGHIGFVFFMYGGRRFLDRLRPMIAKETLR
ncbi:MAG: cytochrome b/b6 domain-containing protein [Rhodospirillaceae bacterium]